MTRFGLVAIGLVAALAGCAAPAPAVPTEAVPAQDAVAAAAVEHLGAYECEMPEIAEVDMLCGHLTVPLDPADPAGAQIELAVTLSTPAAPRGLMVLLGGGPGGSAIWLVPQVAGLLPEIGGEYQLVAFDQRGTGATALDCPEVQAQTGSSDIRPASQDAVAECAELIADWRPHLASSDVVADLEALRQALGAPTWVLNGTSYGTLTAMRYAMAHPEAVAGLVLDSALPPEGAEPLFLASMQALPAALERACAVTGCASDPVEDLAAVIAAGYDELALFDAIVSTSIIQPTFPGVPEALAAARAGDPSALDELVATTQQASESPLWMFSAATHIATMCLDTPMPWGADVTDPAERRVALDAAVAALAPEDTWPFTTSVAARVATGTACEVWPESLQLPTGLLPDVPVLLLAGEQDLSTPAADAAVLAERFPRGELVVVEMAGHGVQATPTGREALADFLAGVLTE